MGFPSPRHLLDVITQEELTDWLRFWRQEPWAADSIEEGMAIMSSVLYSANVGKDAPNLTASSFRAMPRQAVKRDEPTEVPVDAIRGMFKKDG